ncbi:hypothetical protein Ahy_A01g000206 [Arachis hypogaea]|uniref:Endonuclease/exonuclease/phosphatase domain-containing protein n=1 Tax=Arachis hypogaea TaxID=3818 RepID=A0A445EJN0_ARAHY|nr:hypothetical protein Ahy_A01g000206 [Arachis hypogaea]
MNKDKAKAKLVESHILMPSDPTLDPAMIEKDNSKKLEKEAMEREILDKIRIMQKEQWKTFEVEKRMRGGMIKNLASPSSIITVQNQPSMDINIATRISHRQEKNLQDKPPDPIIKDPARGHSGGIWCLWNSDEWKVDVLRNHQQLLHMRLLGKDLQPWVFTAIYGSPQRAHRRELWRILRELNYHNKLSWCLAGDFNALLHDFERQGGSATHYNGACVNFQECVSDCGLLDLGYSGYPFTWKRGNLVERLDRGLSNMDWQI